MLVFTREAILSSILLGMASLLAQFALLNVGILFRKEALAMLTKDPPLKSVRRTISVGLVQPISEELFYRGTLESLIIAPLGTSSIFVVSGMFVAQHFVDPKMRQNFASWRTRLHLLLVSLGLSGLLFFTHSLFACILMHVIVNSPFVAFRLVKLFMFEKT